MKSRKMVLINLSTGRNRDTDVEDGFGDAAGTERVERTESGERSSEIHISPCVKQVAGGKPLHNTRSSAWCSVTTQRGEMVAGVRGAPDGGNICLLIHVVQQKPKQRCKAIILQLNNYFLKVSK